MRVMLPFTIRSISSSPNEGEEEIEKDDEKKRGERLKISLSPSLPTFLFLSLPSPFFFPLVFLLRLFLKTANTPLSNEPYNARQLRILKRSSP